MAPSQSRIPRNENLRQPHDARAFLNLPNGAGLELFRDERGVLRGDDDDHADAHVEDLNHLGVVLTASPPALPNHKSRRMSSFSTPCTFATARRIAFSVPILSGW